MIPRKKQGRRRKRYKKIRKAIGVDLVSYERVTKLAKRITRDIFHTEGNYRTVSRSEIVEICVDRLWEDVIRRIRKRHTRHKIFRVIYDELYKARDRKYGKDQDGKKREEKRKEEQEERLIEEYNKK